MRFVRRFCIPVVFAALLWSAGATANLSALNADLQGTVDEFNETVETAQRSAEECDPATQDCAEQQEASEQLTEQQSANQEALDSINERLRSSGYRLDGLDADGNPRFSDLNGNPLAKLGEAELGFSLATRDGIAVERFGSPDRGISVEIVRDANNQVADLRVAEFSGDVTGFNAGTERGLVDIPADQIADLRATDSGPGPRNTGSGNSGPVNDPGNGQNLPAPPPPPDSGNNGGSQTGSGSPSNGGSQIDSGAATTENGNSIADTLRDLRDRAVDGAQELYRSAEQTVERIIEEIQNPAPRPQPELSSIEQQRRGDTATASDTKETVYEIPGSRAENQNRIAVVVDTNDRIVPFNLDLVNEPGLYQGALVTSDLGSPEVRQFIERYSSGPNPPPRVDLFSHGTPFSLQSGVDANGRPIFLTAGTPEFRNTFSGLSNDFCLYGCRTGGALYNPNGGLNTDSMPYQLSSLTGGTVTSFDRVIYAGAYATPGTVRYSLTVPSYNPYPTLTNTAGQLATVYHYLSLLP